MVALMEADRRKGNEVCYMYYWTLLGPCARAGTVCRVARLYVDGTIDHSKHMVASLPQGLN
jgi:hypothetical protein